MQIEGMLCPYCHTILHEDDQAVSCSACGLAHHLECWNENQGCTTYGCQGKPLNSKLAPEPDMKIHTDTSIRCPNCGSVSSNFSRYCFACGGTLLQESVPPTQFVQSADPFQSSQNNASSIPYSSHTTEYGASGFGSQANHTNSSSNHFETSRYDYYSLYIKKNQSYYMEAFQDLDAGKKKFNWTAFFLNVLWLAYRKMFLMALVFSLIIDSIMAFFTEYTGIFGPIVLGVIVGLFGNGLYKKSIDKKIKKLQISGKSDQDIRIILTTQSDASAWYAVVFIITYVFANAMLLALLNS